MKGLKKAVGDYNRLNRGGKYDPLYGIMYYDFERDCIWTNEYYDLGHNSYTAYDSKDIINLSKLMDDKKVKVTMKNVKDFIAIYLKRDGENIEYCIIDKEFGSVLRVKGYENAWDCICYMLKDDILCEEGYNPYRYKIVTEFEYRNHVTCGKRR